MGKGKVVLLSVVGTLVVLGLAALIVIYTGAYDVAATRQHSPLVDWALSTLMEHSVKARADQVAGTMPTDQASLEKGLEHYDEDCVPCHGAPGRERGELGKGVTPTPPDLGKTADEWSDKEIFWIVKHGIRLAGMPAFGPTQTDSNLWDIAAAVRKLPTLSPDVYAHSVAAAKGSGEAGEEGGGAAGKAGESPRGR